AGELVDAVGALDQATVHVDVSAGKGESVDLFGVDDVEVPVEIRAAGTLGERLAEGLDIGADRRIGDDWQLGVDLCCILPAESDFLVLRDGAGRNDEKESGD